MPVTYWGMLCCCRGGCELFALCDWTGSVESVVCIDWPGFLSL